MNIESIKSVLLTVLVLLSIFLTWRLWTYHPEYETIENTNNVVKEVSISNKKQLSSLITPTKIIFHHQDLHVGTTETTNIHSVMNQVRKWEISNIVNISSTINDGEYSSFMERAGHVEILYSDDLPMNIIRSFIQINDKDLKSISIDRIVIDVHLNNNEPGKVYLVSDEKQEIYEANVSRESISEFKQLFYDNSTSFTKYIAYRPSKSHTIYLPQSDTSINTIQYYTDFLDPEIFKEALFQDPTSVKKHPLTYGEEYTDGSRLLRVFSGKKYFQYINPVNTTENDGTETTELLKTSIDFVNDHGGWTDNYRFFRWNSNENMTLFRLYVNNLPVFNKSGLTEIQQIWGKNEIIRYQRPLLTLEIAIPSKQMDLPGGGEVIKRIESLQDFDPNLIGDITIGYELVEIPDKSNVVTLMPIWSFEYDGVWRKIEFVDATEGGNKRGME